MTERLLRVDIPDGTKRVYVKGVDCPGWGSDRLLANFTKVAELEAAPPQDHKPRCYRSELVEVTIEGKLTLMDIGCRGDWYSGYSKEKGYEYLPQAECQPCPHRKKEEVK